MPLRSSTVLLCNGSPGAIRRRRWWADPGSAALNTGMEHFVPNRRPAGIPTGGQFAPAQHAESTATLKEAPVPGDRPPAPPGVDPELYRSRREALQRAGYVEPISLRAAELDPASSAHRQEWWDTAFVEGEYGHANGDQPKMPDDFTPARSGGQALSGHRRTHRMCYRGSGVSMRMPSVTSVRAFASELAAAGHRPVTFDVPVTATHPGGSVSGWVRVTWGDDGHWATRGLGFDAASSAYVAEAAQCVIEARRPSRALREVGDLIERRRGRAARLGTTLQPVASAWISRLGYSPATSTMVMTSGPRRYGFQVPPHVYQEMASSLTPGRVFNQVVKGHAARVEVAECPRCGRFAAAVDGAGDHRCPTKEAPRRPPPTLSVAAAQARLRNKFWGGPR